MSQRTPSQPVVIDIDILESIARNASAIAPGTWHWHGNTSYRSGIELTTWVSGLGRCTVMRPVRYGMQNAQPAFLSEDLFLHRAHDLVQYEVGRQDLVGEMARKHPGLYRQDVRGIAHPIAEHMAAASPDAILALIARIRALESEIADLRTVIA